MKNILKLALPLFSVIILGAGCFGFGGGETGADGGVWISTDAGLGWAQKTALPTAGGVKSIGGLDIGTFEVDPKDSNVIYVGTKTAGIVYSIDGGESWQFARDEVVRSGSVRDIEVASKDTCSVYAIKEARLMKTDNCLRSFNAELYSGSAPLLEVEVDWFNNEIVWVATNKGEILKSINGGKTWATVFQSEQELSDMIISAADSRVVFVATTSSGLISTSDGGASWQEIGKTDFEQLPGARTVYNLVQEEKGKVIIASTRYGLIRSRDSGNTWEGISLLTPVGEARITSVAIDPINENKIYYGTSDTFYATDDGGVNWRAKRLPTTRAATALSVDLKDGNKIYLGGTTIQK